MKPYYGLRVISVIYKSLMLLTVISTLGALGYLSAQAITATSPGSMQRFIDWLPQALTLTIGGGLLALTLYVLAQLIDIQIEQTKTLRSIEARLAQPNTGQTPDPNVEALRTELRAAVQQITLASRAARLQNPPPHAAPTKTIGGTQPPP